MIRFVASPQNDRAEPNHYIINSFIIHPYSLGHSPYYTCLDMLPLLDILLAQYNIRMLRARKANKPFLLLLYTVSYSNIKS